MTEAGRQHRSASDEEQRLEEAKRERLRTALRHNKCYSCQRSRHLLSWLTWMECSRCGAPHCSGCRSPAEDPGLSTGTKWTCLHCGHVNKGRLGVRE